MIAKRATRKLRDAGIVDFEIHKGKYGFSIRHIQWTHQSGLVYPTADAAVDAAIRGERPKNLENIGDIVDRMIAESTAR